MATGTLLERNPPKFKAKLPLELLTLSSSLLLLLILLLLLLLLLLQVGYHVLYETRLKEPLF